MTVDPKELEQTIRKYCKNRGITEKEFIQYLGEVLKEVKDPTISRVSTDVIVDHLDTKIKRIKRRGR